MKAYSFSFKVMQFIVQNNDKFPSYDVLNGHRYSKNSSKAECLMSHSGKPYKQLGVKFLLGHI